MRAGGPRVKGGPGRFTFVSGSRRGSPGGGRRRGEAAARPAHHSLHLIAGRCARRKARASRSRSRTEGRRCSAAAATMSYQGKKNIPRITVSPGAAASLPLSPGPLRCGRGGLDPWSGPRGGTETRVWGWRAAVSPAGAEGATQTERPWGLGKTKQNKGNPNTGAENLGLCSLLSHRPVVPQEPWAHGCP